MTPETPAAGREEDTLSNVRFYWARIGDGNPEPVAVKRENGKRVCYTLACPDPYDVEGKTSPVKLGDRIEPDYDFLRPDEQALEDKRDARRREYYFKKHTSHSYAGFGR